jgi:hypothetical protein
MKCLAGKLPQLQSQSPAVFDKVRACLQLLSDRHRIVRHPPHAGGELECEADWLQMALSQPTRETLHAAIASPQVGATEIGRDPLHVGLSEVLDSRLWQAARARSVDLTKSVADYRRHLVPLLRYASALSLIDPWAAPHKPGYRRTLGLVSELLGSRRAGTRGGRVTIHVGDPGAYDMRYMGRVQPLLDAWEELLRPMVGDRGHRFRVVCWMDRARGQRMHDRFIITDQAGVLTPYGLDCDESATPSSTTWVLLDQSVWLKRLADFDRPTSPFQYLGERAIS